MADIGSVDGKGAVAPGADTTAQTPRPAADAKTVAELVNRSWIATWGPVPREADRFFLSSLPAVKGFELRGLTPVGGQDAVHEALRNFARQGPLQAAAAEAARHGRVTFNLSDARVTLSPKAADATFHLGDAQVSLGFKMRRDDSEQVYLRFAMPIP